MDFNFDLAAILALGGTAALLFWRLLARVESKVDYVVQNVVTKTECAAFRDSYTEMFNGHDHTKEGDLVIIRRPHGNGTIHQKTERVPGSSDEVVSKGFGKVLGETF